MTKQAKQAWIELLPILIGGLLLPFLTDILKGRMTPQPCGCHEGRRKGALVAVAFFAYAAFIAVTVLLVKLAWRWIL